MGAAARSGEVLARETQSGVTRDTWAGSACSPGAALYMAKLPTLQHLFGFYTEARQGPVRQDNISADISPPGRAALLRLCVRHLWLCQKTARSLFSQAKPFACAKVPRI